MTEPNVLGNISIAKFIVDPTNTKIINLWSADAYNTTPLSMHTDSAGTTNGIDYEVPAAKVFYLLNLKAPENQAFNDVDLMRNTTTDSSTGATTLQKFCFTKIISTDGNGLREEGFDCCCKFVATEFVIPVKISGNDIFMTGWGVECDA